MTGMPMTPYMSFTPSAAKDSATRLYPFRREGAPANGQNAQTVPLGQACSAETQK